MKEKAFMLMGAVAGGLVGYFGFLWIARQGFYALVLPGGLVGVGASLFQNKSIRLCVVCGLLALVLGFLAEWQFAPFIKDGNFGYFLTHIYQLKPITLIMIGAGALVGFGRRSAVVSSTGQPREGSCLGPPRGLQGTPFYSFNQEVSLLLLVVLKR
jgi:hypothetical protein